MGTIATRQILRLVRHLEALWRYGELATIVVAGEATGDAFAVVDHLGPRGMSPPWHRQPGDDETFYVLDGEMTFWVNSAEKPSFRGGPGSIVFVPPGTEHSFRVESETARFLSIHTPARHERFYRATETRRSSEPSHRRALLTSLACRLSGANTAWSSSDRHRHPPAAEQRQSRRQLRPSIHQKCERYPNLLLAKSRDGPRRRRSGRGCRSAQFRFGTNSGATPAQTARPRARLPSSDSCRPASSPPLSLS